MGIRSIVFVVIVMGGRVLIVGSGGREHALASALGRSALVETVYANADWISITPKGSRADFDTKNAHELAADRNVDLTVVGPEVPLVGGIADRFLENGLRLFGPARRAARLESSKAYAKEFMEAFDIPTARFRTFRDYRGAVRYLEKVTGPVYIKASGLAAGKGALPGRTFDEARDAARRIMVKREFGDAGDEIVIEEFLQGEEASCVALMNSSALLDAPFLFSQDHKKLLDGDEGPNTGGMGAYAPTTLVTPGLRDKINRQVLWQTMKGLRYEHTDYTGFLYPGLMVDKDIPFVLEYNVRAGDPETQPLVVLAGFDFYLAMQNVIDGKRPELKWRDGYAVCVILASKGYPEKPETGKLIHGLRERDDAVVFHAGTKKEGDNFYTSSGRALGVTGYGETISEAVSRTYAAIGRENGGIWFEGMQFRRDIGRWEIGRRHK